MAVVIGFNFPVGHDPAVAVIVDGRLVFATEEERYSRHKHAFGELPVNSMLEAFKFLANLGVGPEDVDAFALPFDLDYWRRRDRFTVFLMMAKSILGAEYMPGYGYLARLSIESLFRRSVQGDLARVFLKNVYKKVEKDYPSHARVVPVAHHLAHAASAFYFSGFPTSAVLTVDANGETDSTVVWQVKNGEFERVSTISFWEGSLGALYELVGQRLGFDPFEAPGKVMGLAPYGEPNEVLRERFGRIARTPDGGPVPYVFSEEFTRTKQMYPKMLELLTTGLDLHWEPRKELSKPAADLAWNLQEFLERMVMAVARWAKAQTSETRVSLAGGVALNAKANMELHYSELYEDMFIFPAASDAGTPIGAAAYVYHNVLGEKMRQERLEDVYLGADYDDSVVRDVVRRSKWAAEFTGDDTTQVAELVAKGNCVAWYQGRSELGPRALGNRSIIGDPTKKEMWGTINEIKGREFWRPLAPSVLDKDKEIYFKKPTDHRFMILMLKMTQDGSARIPAVCHVDKTARPQVVSKASSPKWYELIKSFGDLKGENALVNTSFNLAREPLVQTPEDALRSFALGSIDALYLQGWLIKKRN